MTQEPIPEGIEALPNGDWVIKGDTHLSKWAFEHGSIISDPWLMKYLDPILDKVDVVWDVGAAIGDHTKHYLNRGKRVIAIEPNPLVFQCLKHNCPTAECFNLAASDEAGTLRFAVNPNVGASRIAENGKLEVHATTMDSLGLPPPGLVKIDVEGYELFALRGMEISLATYKPVVFIEANRGALAANGHKPEDITEFFQKLGYTKFSTYPPEALPCWEQFDFLITP